MINKLVAFVKKKLPLVRQKSHSPDIPKITPFSLKIVLKVVNYSVSALFLSNCPFQAF